MPAYRTRSRKPGRLTSADEILRLMADKDIHSVQWLQRQLAHLSRNTVHAGLRSLIDGGRIEEVPREWLGRRAYRLVEGAAATATAPAYISEVLGHIRSLPAGAFLLRADVFKAIKATQSTVSNALTLLVESGDLTHVDKGLYQRTDRAAPGDAAPAKGSRSLTADILALLKDGEAHTVLGLKAALPAHSKHSIYTTLRRLVAVGHAEHLGRQDDKLVCFRIADKDPASVERRDGELQRAIAHIRNLPGGTTVKRPAVAEATDVAPLVVADAFKRLAATGEVVRVTPYIYRTVFKPARVEGQAELLEAIREVMAKDDLTWTPDQMETELASRYGVLPERGANTHLVRSALLALAGQGILGRDGDAFFVRIKTRPAIVETPARGYAFEAFLGDDDFLLGDVLRETGLSWAA